MRRGLPFLLAFLAVPAGVACGSDSRDAAPAKPAPTTADRDGARTAQTQLALRRFGDFMSPTFLTAPPADRRRIMVVERAGAIRVVRGGRVLRRPFLDVSKTRAGSIPTDGERGLLSMAFAPDYRKTRRFYVYFTDRRGDITIGEFRRSRTNPDRADPGSYRLVIRQEHRRFSNHDGGQLQFGPDGYLYAGLGDGGGGGDPLRSGQDLSTLLGKLIRIDPRRHGRSRYRVPRDNPFVSRNGARPEIWAYGLRNPFRFSFDRRTGDLLIGDVGQETIEEIDFLERGKGAGSNFGWSCFEGSQRFRDCDAAGHVKPVLELRHDSGVCSITGGYVVRDRGLGSLYGRYLYGDFCASALRAAKVGSGSAEGDGPTGLSLDSVASFGEDACGRLYVLSLNGRVSRVSGPSRSVCTRSIVWR